MEPPRPKAPDSGFFKSVGEELRRSEERYRSLFENMREAVAHCRLVFEGGRPVDVVFLEVNAAFERLTGLRDVPGRRFTETLPGILERNPASFETCVRVVANRRPEKFETLVQPLGIWLSVSVHSPEPDCLVVVFDNITGRKESEARLTGQVEELRRWHEATLGRETRVLELKKEVNDLLARAGEPPRYRSVTEDAGGGPDG